MAWYTRFRDVQKMADRINRRTPRARRAGKPGPPVGPPLVVGRGYARRRYDPWQRLRWILYGIFAIGILALVAFLSGVPLFGE